MGRSSNTDERRQQIVHGLAQVIATHGYDGASVAEVARTVGLAPGLVHYHFKNKQEILLSLLESLGETLRTRVADHLAAAGAEPVARLHAFIDAHLAVDSSADPRLVACWTAVTAEAVRQEAVRAAYRKVVEEDLGVLEQLAKDCLSATGASTRSARTIAAGLFAAIEGYFVLASALPDAIPPGSAARSTRLMADGLLGPGRVVSKG